MIKKILLSIVLASTLVTSLSAAKFLKKATVIPELVQQGEGKQWCPVCGMKIESYYKTSYIAKLEMNDNLRQYCSIRCLVMDMEEYGIDQNSIKVIDVTSQKYIYAKDAYYVVKSKIMGTMTKVSKLAFKNKSDAVKFKKKYKGKIVSFDTALNMAKKSLKLDIAMIKKKKIKKIYPRGKKILAKACKQDKIDPSNYIEINELKQNIVTNKLCKPLKERDLQALALYIWEVKRFGEAGNIEGKVKVNEKEKCPVCGMFTYKYPRWAAQIFYKHEEHEHHLSFDGVKDLMKFYFNSKKWGNYPFAKKENITKILVTDYYTQKGIDGTKAFYVIKSDIYGPMGHELIPFENIEDAKIFKKDHYGKKIIKFDDITETQTYKLDES